MLRNRGVNVTERKIRQDVLRAYECDIFEVPRCRYQDPYQAQYYRQPRYRTVPKQVYHAVKSSVSNYGRGRSREYGARRVYLPENEWGASSAESMIFVRNPRFNTGSYYPNEAFERPFRRDCRYPDGYYTRRASSIYMDDDDLERFHATRDRIANNSPIKQTQLVRKVTRKLSPIFTCDGATTSNIKQRNRTNIDHDIPKTHQTQLSKEARNLSCDIYRILSILRKNDETLSSISLLQNIQNLDFHNSKSGTNPITQRVQISSKMPRQKQGNPSERFKTATGVRSKLEALLSALKQYEEEKILNDVGSSDAANHPNYNNDSPSLEDRSFINEEDKRSSTNIVAGSRQKDIVLQTEKPKMSNKNVFSTIKTRKDNMIIERKSSKSRLSWKKGESTGLDDRIGSILDAKPGQTTNKAGFMIKIGGNPQRKNTRNPKEKQKDKMPKTWIKKFLDSTKDSKNNNIHVRWNNKGFYSKSSSTIFELVNNVYKQLGIKDYAKNDDISVSDIKTTPKRKKSRIPKSKYTQKVKAYMVPQTIVPGPVYMPGKVTNNSNVHETEEVLNTRLSSVYNTKPSSCDVALKKQLNTVNYLCSNSFKIHMPGNFFGRSDRLSTARDDCPRIPFCDDEVNKIVEYENIGCNSIDRTIFGNNYFSGDRIYDLNIGIYFNMVELTQSLCLDKGSESEETNITNMRPGSELTISQLQIDFPHHEPASHSFPKRSCSLVNKMMEDEYLNWMPAGVDPFIWDDNCEETVKVLPINDQEASVISLSTSLGNIDSDIETSDHDSTNNEVNTVASEKLKLGFGKIINRTFSSNLIRWKDRTKKTISGSLIGAKCKKPVGAFWNLFWDLLKTPKHKQRSPAQDLACLRPPKIVSEPECCYNPQNPCRPPKPRSCTTVLTTEKITMPNEPIIIENVTSLIQTSYSGHELKTEQDKTEEQPSISRLTQGSIQSNQSIHDIGFKSTKESEYKLTLDKPPVSENNSESQPISTKAEPDVISKSRHPSRIMELIRSNHNIKDQKRIKFLIKQSLPLLHQNLHHYEFLLPGSTQQHLIRKFPIELRLQNYYNQCLNIHCKYDKNLKTDKHKRQKDISEKSMTHDVVETIMHMVSNETDDETVIEGKESTKTTIDETKEEVQDAYVAQVSSFKNNVSSSNNNCIDINKSSSVNLSLKITKGDMVTRISIKNHDRNKVSNLKFIDQSDSQETAVHINRNPTKLSTNKLPNNEIKVFINIENTNSEKVTFENPITDHVIEDQILNEPTDTDHKITKNSPDLKPFKSGDLQGSQDDSVHKPLETHTRSTSRTHATKITNPNSIYGSELEGFLAVDETSCFESYFNNSTTVNDVKEVHNKTTDKSNTEHKNVNHVVAVKRLLNAMIMLNANKFTGKALLHDIAREQNESCTSLREQTSRRKDFVNISSDINMAHRTSDNSKDNVFRKFMQVKESFDELQSGDSCSGCNVLTRKSNSHRLVGGKRHTSYKFKAKGHIAANYNIPHLTNRVLQKPRKALDDYGFADHNEVKFASQTMTSKVNLTETKDKNSQDGKPICWYCGKRANKKNLKNNENNDDNIKELKSELCKNNALTHTNPCQSKKLLFTEYKVIIKKDDPFEERDSETDNSDILQSQKVKKAVLQIYSETVPSEGYLIAKIPKYLRL